MKRNEPIKPMRLEFKYKSDLGEYIVGEGRITFRDAILRRGLSVNLRLLDAFISDLQHIKADLIDKDLGEYFERVEEASDAAD